MGGIGGTHRLEMLTVLIHHTHKVVLNVYLIMKLIEHKLYFLRLYTQTNFQYFFMMMMFLDKVKQDEKQKGE